MNLLRVVARHHLHPELDLHPSWLPADWPARHRRIEQLGPSGRAVLGQLLRRDAPEPDWNFDSTARRLALLDMPSLRRLAAYTGLGAHKPLFRGRGVGSQLRRQARRFDADGADFVIDRMPQLPDLRMNPRRLQERPAAAGRVAMERGYRLLLATVAPEGAATLARVQRKLPRRIAALPLPPLGALSRVQLRELMLLCIVPERLPQWDWLF